MKLNAAAEMIPVTYPGFGNLHPFAPADQTKGYETLVRRLRNRAQNREGEAAALVPDDDYLRELNEAYQHFFFHYSATSLLVVETSHVDFHESEEAFDGLLKQIRGMGRGTRYYVPRTS